MEPYLNVRKLLDEALRLLDALGETLIAAHLTAPIAVLDERIDSLGDTPDFVPLHPR